MIKKLLALNLLCLATATQAETLKCFYPAAVIDNPVYAKGHVLELVGDRFVFLTTDNLIIMSSLVNCYIEGKIPKEAIK